MLCLCADVRKIKKLPATAATAAAATTINSIQFSSEILLKISYASFARVFACQSPTLQLIIFSFDLGKLLADLY